MQDYETVEERLRRFHSMAPDARVITEWVDFAQEEGKPWRWMFKTSIYLNADDHEKRLPKATGYASELEVGKQAQWAAELAETSSIGRALANMNLSGNKRASREEMEKVARAEVAKRDWLAEAEAFALVYDLAGLRRLYSEAVANRAPAQIIEQVKQLGADVADGSSDSDGKPGGSKGVA